VPVPVPVPTPEHAAQLVERALGERAVRVERFPTGHAHYVYDVLTESGRPLVARIARPDHPQSISDAVGWSRLLRPLGVPLPALLHADADAKLLPFASMLLERLPGTDLGNCHAALTREQKRELARQVCAVQQRLTPLNEGQGFGFAPSYDGPFAPSWRAVVESSLSRSRQRIAGAKLATVEHVARVEALLPRFEADITAVPPRPFLDDITTKNVLVHEGQLSGIVDVDHLCFGDALFTVALTRASLLNLGEDLEYVEAWCEELELDARRRAVLELYTALFLVDFLSELGQLFNREQPASGSEHIARLDGLLDESLGRLGS
jgi:hypothetical protein